jgi:hypothetical protein
MEDLLEGSFSMHSVSDQSKVGYHFFPELDLSTRVEAGSNTSTVTLRVVGGDEKGSLKSETVKYGRESQGTRTRERLCWQGSATYKR